MINLYSDAIDALNAKYGEKPNYANLIGVYDRNVLKEKIKSYQGN